MKISKILKNIILKKLAFIFKMALLKYFKEVDEKKPTKSGTVHPKPYGPILSIMPMSSVEGWHVWDDASVRAMP